MNEENSTFRIGITMAGAVSAGAYTAGFMDYLFEVLNLWEIEKNRIRKKIEENILLTENERKIPLHDVSIEVLGGASAGGMVSVMSALSLHGGLTPVKEPTDKKTGNILYDSWVLLDDDIENNISTFEKMLATDDLSNNTRCVASLLNSKPIDKIADRVFKKFSKGSATLNYPSYVSDDLRVLLTLCNLKGIPFEVKFQEFGSANFQYAPGHRMTEHMLIAHFKMKIEEGDVDKYLEFNLNDPNSIDLIKLCTKATGAFPLGLAPRHFKDKISSGYVKNALIRSLKIDVPNAIDIKIQDGWYNFTDVDGGTINNEPYDEVMQVLKERVVDDNPNKPMMGTLMIDPFPNFYNQDNPEEGRDNNLNNNKFQKCLIPILGKLITTLMDQVRVKKMGLLYENDYRILAFPYKWEQRGVRVNHPPLASSSIGGFGGFLDREFRKHDFFLGRNNARNMLNVYFSLEYNEGDIHPLLAGLTDEMKETFLINGRFPIIPDVNKVLMGDNYPHPFHYDYADYPKLNSGYFDKIRKPFKTRLDKILKIELKNNISGSWFLRNGLQLARKLFIKKLSNKLIDKMKTILENRNQIRE